MMKNNTTTNFESELDAAHEAFLKQLKKIPASEISYQGHTYVVPAHQRNKLTTSFAGLKLSYGTQSITPKKGKTPRFTADRKGTKGTWFSLYMGVTDCGEPDQVCRATYYIYREGNPHHLTECHANLITGFDAQDDFMPLDAPLAPGNYFLLADGLTDEEDGCLLPLGQYFHLPFVVMEPGDEIAHPQILEATVTRPEDELKAGPCSSGTLRATIHYASSLPVGHEFSAVCYTEDWRIMGQDEHQIARPKRGKQLLQFDFQSELIWLPGHYTIVLMQNREPFATVAFKYQGEAKTESKCLSLSPTGMEACLTKSLMENDAWNRTGELCGMAHLKPQLAKLMQKSDYNTFCEQQCLADLRENVYASVTGENVFHAMKLAEKLPKLLNYCTTGNREIDCNDWVRGGSSIEWTEERSGQAVTLYNISALCEDGDRTFLTLLEDVVEDNFTFFALTLCGTEEEMRQLFACSPILARNILPEYRFRIDKPSVAETLHLLQQEIGRTSFKLDENAENELARQVIRHHEGLRQWNETDFFRYVMQGIVKHVKRRIHANYVSSAKKPSRKELITILPEDIGLDKWIQAKATRETAPSTTSPAHQDKTDDRLAFEGSMKELNAMTGLTTLKEALNAFFCQARFNKRRQQLGLPAEEQTTHHIIFTGNPGTGKSTVARLMGKIFHALGILSKGEVIATERRELVGRYIGETEEHMNALLKRAQGNVLFIDEAYNLHTDTDDQRDYGNRVIESLLTLLAEPNPDMVVVLAGYKEEMEKLLDSNPGLRSRFPHQYHFEDYNADELMQIARETLAKGDYRLTPEAETLLHDTVEETLKHKDRHFANARWIKTILTTGVLPAMALRVIQGNAPDNADLFRNIERADVEKAIRDMAASKPSNAKPRPRIGFTI